MNIQESCHENMHFMPYCTSFQVPYCTSYQWSRPVKYYCEIWAFKGLDVILHLLSYHPPCHLPRLILGVMACEIVLWNMGIQGSWRYIAPHFISHTMPSAAPHTWGHGLWNSVVKYGHSRVLTLYCTSFHITHHAICRASYLGSWPVKYHCCEIWTCKGLDAIYYTSCHVPYCTLY